MIAVYLHLWCVFLDSVPGLISAKSMGIPQNVQTAKQNNGSFTWRTRRQSGIICQNKTTVKAMHE